MFSSWFVSSRSLVIFKRCNRHNIVPNCRTLGEAVSELGEVIVNQLEHALFRRLFVGGSAFNGEQARTMVRRLVSKRQIDNAAAADQCSAGSNGGVEKYAANDNRTR